MTYRADVRVTLRPSILDPQGKTVHHALSNLGYGAVERVRMGKYVELWVEAEDAEEAEHLAREVCEKLLANPVMENFTVEVEEAELESA